MLLNKQMAKRKCKCKRRAHHRKRGGSAAEKFRRLKRVVKSEISKHGRPVFNQIRRSVGKEASKLVGRAKSEAIRRLQQGKTRRR